MSLTLRTGKSSNECLLTKTEKYYEKDTVEVRRAMDFVHTMAIKDQWVHGLREKELF